MRSGACGEHMRRGIRIGSGLMLVGVLGASAPAGRYVVSAGTVYDTVTHLTWQQAVSNGSYAWSSAGAAGSAQDYCQSLQLGGSSSGWRLPTMKELISIVDVSTDNPAIDGTAFPEAPATSFWTSSPSAINASLAWAVSFDDGSSAYFAAGNAFAVRCVQSGP